MSGITLHPKLGLNMHMTYCPRCGGDGQELIMLGIRNHARKCSSCGAENLGAGPLDRCGKCGERGTLNSDSREIGEHERLPGGLCRKCDEELASHKAIVAEGGVYWRCADCKSTGVIRKGGYATAVRSAHGTPAPDPLGVEFTKEDCPVCGPQAG